MGSLLLRQLTVYSGFARRAGFNRSPLRFTVDISRRSGFEGDPCPGWRYDMLVAAFAPVRSTVKRIMTALRRHVRLWAVAWLVLQVAMLLAFVPQDCCAAHKAAALSAPPCHENTPAARCPMRGANGAACPMHSRSQSNDHADHSHHKQPSSSDCSIRGTCNGPMAAMLALLSNYGILPDGFLVAPDDGPSLISTSAQEDLVSRLASPRPPPPRA